MPVSRLRNRPIYLVYFFIYLQEAAKDKESLKAHGVTHILTVNGKDPAFKDDFEYK